MMDTIFALSTAPGKAGVAVIRISGSGACAALNALGVKTPKARQAVLFDLTSIPGANLYQVIVLYFKQNQRVTGEDIIELQCHGSPAIIAALLSELGKMDGLRQADPGEFTRRALENGQLDMARVEGLADLLEAETEAQRRQALRVFSGDLGRLAEDWRRQLIRAAALLEATIDFADEEVPVDVAPEVTDLLSSVLSDLRREIDGVRMAERVRHGFEVAILGAPNVGKSTLLNMLAGREAAITSEVAGTTRDVIEVRMDIEGIPVTLLDTAGLRETEDHVEAIGIRRARDRATQADLRVFLVEGAPDPDWPIEEDDLVFQAKSDLGGDIRDGISGKTGAGVDILINRVGDRLRNRVANVGVATRLRHQQAMTRACRDLESALNLVKQGDGFSDLAAEEMRSGIRALDSLVGRVDVEAVLDEIFASFCLGK